VNTELDRTGSVDGEDFANEPSRTDSHDARSGTVRADDDVAVSRNRERTADEARGACAPNDSLRVDLHDFSRVGTGVDRAVITDCRRTVDVCTQVDAPRERARRSDRVNLMILRADDHDAVVRNRGRSEDLLLCREAPRHVTCSPHVVDGLARSEEDRSVFRERCARVRFAVEVEPKDALAFGRERYELFRVRPDENAPFGIDERRGVDAIAEIRRPEARPVRASERDDATAERRRVERRLVG
jgi:hypothetical protein